jgi:hypothetical protein
MSDEPPKRLIFELFDEEFFAPLVVVALVAFTGFGGAHLFKLGLDAGQAVLGAVVALGAFAAGVAALYILLRRG